jgi:prephenate dehydrogenase
LQTDVLFPRLALLGVGYIGGSAALAARRAGAVGKIVGYDPSQAATQAAIRMGVIDASCASPQEAVAGATLVLLAAPVRSMEALLRAMAPALVADSTVIDVGSVKAGIVAAAEAALPAGCFVGCHPMAGAEFSGVEAADADIFAGRVCFICPSRDARASAVSSAEAFWRLVGCQTSTIEPDIHDRLMAAQSHLPHVAAFALAGALVPALPFLESTTTAASPTTSLRDTTRIAASGPAVWRDILLANATHVLPLIHELETRVAEIKSAVATGDGEALERILSAAQSCRKRLVRE